MEKGFFGSALITMISSNLMFYYSFTFYWDFGISFMSRLKTRMRWWEGVLQLSTSCKSSNKQASLFNFETYCSVLKLSCLSLAKGNLLMRVKWLVGKECWMVSPFHELFQMLWCLSFAICCSAEGLVFAVASLLFPNRSLVAMAVSHLHRVLSLLFWFSSCFVQNLTGQ